MLEFDINKYIHYEDKPVLVIKPVYVVPKPAFPNEKKKVENPSLTEKGKHKSKKKVPTGQIKLPL